MNKIVVSICCITYNHEHFIRKCLDGFLMQKTNFRFEILIHDDASTDGTIQIIREYTKKHSHIKPIIQKFNQFSQGKRAFNVKYNFDRAQGKYIALCEGDDYWTDPFKLQKQVDFLEANTDYVLSFHDALVIHQNKNNETSTFKERFKKLQQRTTFYHKDVVEGWFMPTASMVFKNGLIKRFPNWITKVYSGDYTLQLLISQHGKIKFHDEICCTHIKHEAGISQRKDLEAFRLDRRIYQMKKYLSHFDKKFRFKFATHLLHSFYQKLENEKNEMRKILLHINIWILAKKQRYIYYYQQFSFIQLKEKAMNKIRSKLSFSM